MAKAEIIREEDLEKREEFLLKARWRDVAKAKGALEAMQILVKKVSILKKRGEKISGIQSGILKDFRAIAHDIYGFLSDTQKSQIVFNQIIYYRNLLPTNKLKTLEDTIFNELNVAQRVLANDTASARETLARLESNISILGAGVSRKKVEETLWVVEIDALLLRKNFLLIISALETEKRALKDLRKVLKKEEIIV